MRSLKDGRCELNARGGNASLRMFSTRATCLEAFTVFKTLHGLDDLQLQDFGKEECEGQTSIMDFV